MLAAFLLLCCCALNADDQNFGGTTNAPSSIFGRREALTSSDYLTLPNAPVSIRPDQTDLSLTDASTRSSSTNGEIEPSQPTTLPEGGVQWKKLMKGSLLYLGIMHSFRLATEQGTREGLGN